MRHLMSLALTLLPAGALMAQQPERYTIDGDDIAVYNLAGLLQVESGQGAVTVTVTRGGADASRLKVAQDEIDGRQTLRVMYPADKIRYPLGKGDRTELGCGKTEPSTTMTTGAGTATSTATTDGARATASPSPARTVSTPTPISPFRSLPAGGSRSTSRWAG